MGSTILYDSRDRFRGLLSISSALMITTFDELSTYYRSQPRDKLLNIVYTHFITSGSDKNAVGFAREVLPPFDWCLERVAILIQTVIAKEVRRPLGKNFCRNRVFVLILGV